MKKILKLLALIAWMIIIFYLSGQQGSTSQALSDGILAFINKLLAKSVFWRNLIRKCAHFFEYFVLGILAYINANEYFSKKTLIAVVFVVVFAISDECHQLFIPGRNGNIFDVLLDSLAAIISIYLFKNITKNKK